MAVVPARQGVVITRHLVLLVIAVVIFVIAAFIHIGDASFKYEQTMEWAGFAAFAASFL